MRDASFEDMLTEEVLIRRSTVALDVDGAPQTPTYEELADVVPARLMPASASSDDDLLGRLDEATHVLYVQPFDLRPNDRVVARRSTTELTDDIEQGETLLPVASTAGMWDGAQVEIGSGGTRELRTIVEVRADELVVAPALDAAHGEGEAVSRVRRFDVLAIQDEAGAGHHLRAALREVK